jgi:hypothetical protein
LDSYISDSDQSDSDMYDNDLHEEEKQLDTSNQRVDRQGRTVMQADRDVHNYNTDECSDGDETLLPHRTSGTTACRQETGAPNTRIYQFTGRRQKNLTLHINKDSTADIVFMLCFAAVLVCWRTRLTATVNSTWTHWTNDILQYVTLLNLKCCFFWHILFKWDMTYETA